MIEFDYKLDYKKLNFNELKFLTNYSIDKTETFIQMVLNCLIW